MSHHQATNEHSRRIANLIRFGTVKEADYATAMYRVKDGEFISGWLPHLQLRTSPDQHWWPLEVGEAVAVLIGGDGQGIVLGAVYRGNTGKEATKHQTQYQTGDGWEYDKASKTMTLTADNLVFKAKNINHVKKG